MDKYSLELLYYAMGNRPADYLRFKMRVKRLGIGMKDFERAVKGEAPKTEMSDFDDLPQAIHLDGLDVGGAAAPQRISSWNDQRGYHFRNFTGLRCGASVQ